MAQAQLVAHQQAALMAQGQPAALLMAQQAAMGQSTLIQTSQGLMRVPTSAIQPQVISG